MPCGNQIWQVEPLTKVQCIDGSKVMQGSTGANHESNCSGMPYGTHQILYEEPMSGKKYITEVKDCKGQLETTVCLEMPYSHQMWLVQIQSRCCLQVLQFVYIIPQTKNGHSHHFQKKKKKKTLAIYTLKGMGVNPATLSDKPSYSF